MKKILLTLTGFVLTLLSVAQSPNLMNYQGVARNAVGNVLPLQPVSLRLSILSGSPTGSAVYVETRNVTTNQFGLFNAVVGSPGAVTTTGTIAGINWTAFGTGSGSKFLQVEIDPAGGTNYFNVGSTQLVSVPYALNAGAAAPVGPAGGDLTGTYPNPQIFFPLIKTFNATTLTPANTQLIGMTNSATTGILGAITGTSASNDANAAAITGTMSSTSPGANGTGVKGVSNGTGSLGIGVSGLHAGSGWGVWGWAPSGIGTVGQTTSGFGVWGSASSGIGVYGTSNTNNGGLFENLNAANTANTLNILTNGVGNGVSSISTGTGRGGFFQVNNATSTANALEATTNGTGASWGIRANSSGTNGAGLFVQSNATNTSNNVQSNQAGLGRAGLFQNTNTANDADAVLGTTVTTGTAAAGVHGIAGSSGITVVAKKGGSFESDAGVGLVGSSSTSNGIMGFTNTGITGVSGFSFGTGSGVSGGSVNGPAGNFNLTAPNNSIALTGSTSGGGFAMNAATTGTNRALNVQNTNAANVQITQVLNNFNSSSTGWGNGTLTSLRGTGSTANTYLYTGVPTSVTGIGAAPFAFGVQGTSQSGVGVSGLTTGDPVPGNAIGVLGSAINANGTAMQAINYSTGYALQTQGQLQFTNVNEANNRILASDAVGNATWKNPSAVGIISGSGTINYVPKWTPNGTTLGNSLIFDNGTAVGVGTTTPGAGFVVSGNGIWNSAIGIENTGAGMEWRMNVQGTTYQVTKISGATFTPFQLMSDGQVEFPSTAGTSRLRVLDNGNTGLGTNAPGYKLQVNHGGLIAGSGILSRSTTGASVVDINAFNGDAALRFYNNGVGQWNMRNDPANNDLEVFDLAAGQSRMRVKNTTGNVEIGTANAGAKLRVGGLTQANNTITTASGFPGTNAISVNDAAAVTNEKWGIYSTVNGSTNTNFGIFAEPGTTGATNIGLFSRVSTAPSGGNSYGLYSFDAVNNGTTTWAARIRGRLQIDDGTQGANKVLISDANGNASWQSRIAFRGTGSATTAITTNQDLIFTSEVYDDGSGYDPTTGTFTAPEAGLYHFDAGIRGSNGSIGRVNLCFLSNIQSYFSCSTLDVNSANQNWSAININSDIMLAAGETVNVRIEPLSGSFTPYGFSNYTYFNGHRVR